MSNFYIKKQYWGKYQELTADFSNQYFECVQNWSCFKFGILWCRKNANKNVDGLCKPIKYIVSSFTLI